MKGIRTFYVMSLLAAGSMLSAQDQSYTLTLDQAREFAIQNNKNLMNARDQVTSSKEKIKETKSQGLPQVTGKMDYTTYFNYEMNFSFGGSGGSNIPIDTTIFDAGDRSIIAMLSGMMGSSEPIVMGDQLTGNIQVSQLIYSGQYWAGLEVAKIGRDLTEKNVIRTEQDVKESVTNSYYLILITEQNLRIINGNIDNLKATMLHTGNMFKAGVAEQTDVDQLKVALNQLLNTSKSVERAVQLSYNLLKMQLGLPPDATITLTDSFETVLSRLNPEKTLLNQFNVENNVNYELAETQVRLNKAMVGMNNMSYTPTVAGFYSYTNKILTSGFDLTPNHLAGVSLSLPIFTSGQRIAKVKQSKIDLQMAQRNEELVKEQLEIQYRQVLFNYQNALENYNSQKENVEIAGRVYANIENKYKQGIVSSMDLTQASSNLLSAENNYLSAVLTLLQAQTSLEKLFNQI